MYKRHMAKHIVKTDRGSCKFRVIIPKKVIELKGWENVKYVTIEDHWGDRLVVRRLMLDETAEAENN